MLCRNLKVTGSHFECNDDEDQPGEDLGQTDAHICQDLASHELVGRDRGQDDLHGAVLFFLHHGLHQVAPGSEHGHHEAQGSQDGDEQPQPASLRMRSRGCHPRPG